MTKLVTLDEPHTNIWFMEDDKGDRITVAEIDDDVLYVYSELDFLVTLTAF